MSVAIIIIVSVVILAIIGGIIAAVLLLKKSANKYRYIRIYREKMKDNNNLNLTQVAVLSDGINIASGKPCIYSSKSFEGYPEEISIPIEETVEETVEEPADEVADKVAEEAMLEAERKSVIAEATNEAILAEVSPWVLCANENGVCKVPGTKTVRYGAKEKYLYQTAVGSVVCNNGRGDPLFGVRKACYYDKTSSPVASMFNGDLATINILTDEDMDSVFSTKDGDIEWVVVDLGKEYKIDEVILYNRKDCCQENLENTKIELSKGEDFTSSVMASPYIDFETSKQLVISWDPKTNILS